MINKPSETRIDDNHDYNYLSGSGDAHPAGTGKIDVIIPPQLTEFGPGPARALLRLLVEVHRKRTTKNEQSTEEI